MAAHDTVDFVFKTHLDIRVTGQADAVRRLYQDRFLPQALTAAEHFWRGDLVRPKFVWTTGAWLIHDSIASAAPAQVAQLDQVIERGPIR